MPRLRLKKRIVPPENRSSGRKKIGEAQKKAAEAKEKWTKAQENIRNKEAELAGAKQQQEEARLATRHAQEARHKLKQPMPSTAN
jgi:head-tail adaptor